MSDSGPEAAKVALPKTRYATASFGLIALIIVVGNVAGTLTAPDWIGRIPLQNILKNVLHSSREDTARFFFLTGLFFYLKPIAGILTDAFPLFGTRRRYYLLFSSVLAAAAWVALGVVSQTYLSLLLCAILVNLFVVMLSTVAGAFLVEVGQSRGEVGKLSAVRQVTRSACTMVQGPLGGMLAGMSFLLVSGAGVVCALSIFPVAFFFLRERPTLSRNKSVFRNANAQLATMSKSSRFWLALTFIFLYQFTPGLGTMMYYRQNDVLHFSQQTIGFLGAASGLAGILSAFVYFFLAKRLALRTSLLIAVITSGSSTLLYVFYNSLPAAFLIDFQAGFVGGFATVAFLDLAARGTPAGCEGLGYSLMMSVYNVAAQGADWLGSHIADSYHVAWNTMVYVNAGTTFVVLILLPFMPRMMLAGRDSATPNLENTGEPADHP